MATRLSHLRSVAFRRCLTAGLALSMIVTIVQFMWKTIITERFSHVHFYGVLSRGLAIPATIGFHIKILHQVVHPIRQLPSYFGIPLWVRPKRQKIKAGMDKDGSDKGPKMRGTIWNFSPKLKISSLIRVVARGQRRR